LSARSESNLRVMNDMIDIIEGYGHHWSLWTYEDIGMMGAVLVAPDSEWLRRIKPVRALKTDLRCDSWIERIAGPALVPEVTWHHVEALGDSLTCIDGMALSISIMEAKND
jgi:hypothetical protein